MKNNPTLNSPDLTKKYSSYDDPNEFIKSVKVGDLLWVNYPPLTIDVDNQSLDSYKIAIFQNSNPKDRSKLIKSIKCGTAWAVYVGDIAPAKNPVKTRAKVVVTTQEGELMLGWIQILGLLKPEI